MKTLLRSALENGMEEMEEGSKAAFGWMRLSILPITAVSCVAVVIFSLLF